jgi:hypothetical protein
VFGQAAGLIPLREAVREQLLALLVEFGQLPGREPADVLCSLLLQLGRFRGGGCCHDPDGKTSCCVRRKRDFSRR